jgi:hypothetical protein
MEQPGGCPAGDPEPEVLVARPAKVVRPPGLADPEGVRDICRRVRPSSESAIGASI